MRNVKKLSAAVAMAIGTAGVGMVQADALMFPYVVSSPTVTTILSAVNLDDDGNQLHWRYYYKNGAAATNNAATCDEVDFRWTSSPADLVDVSVDAHFGDAMGVMFNDPSINADYSATTTKSMSLLAGLTTPVRAFAIVDNDTGVQNSRDMTAGQATIIEFVNGAAWGYAAYDPLSDLQSNEYDFQGDNERFGEVFSNQDGQNDPSGGTGSNISYKPFGEFQTNLYVTPIGADDTCTGPDNSNSCTSQDQLRGNLQTQVQLFIPENYGGAETDVAYDRDENLVSGAVRQSVTCVGAVAIQDLMSEGAGLLLEDTGGWSRVRTRQPAPNPANLGLQRTQEATIMFLEYNLGGTIDGVPVNGVVNNGYLIRER